MASQGIRSTKTYIWYLKDVLGTGATSSVYLGRHKKTGDVVAVKMFNHMSYMRPQDVQQREFEVLLKLDHRNIIHLHSIEEDQISKQPVIVMELCTGGSLYSYLDTPQNMYGLKEKEFLCVLKDVSAGMKHLRDNGIIHRDIKPGNIMMVKGDDGAFVYKLADFGAARELEDDEAFMSLYGTEEYLHPDVYERAVLGKRNRTEFTAQTDLWSLGVTFYHTATGSLPFRAYGGRSNREMMHKITTTKKYGMISGVQETSNGPLVWSEDLPKTCHFLPHMRTLVKELLANTMECNMSRMWSFDRFFDYVQKITSMRTIDVFVAQTCDCHRVYVEPERELGYFQAQMAHMTGIQPDTQSLLWEREVIDPKRCFKCEDLPQTSEEKPLILLRIKADASPGLRAPFLPNQPKTATHYSVQQDCTLAKNCAAVICYYSVVLQRFTGIQDLITDTVRAVVFVLKSDYLKLRSEHSSLAGYHLQAEAKMNSVQKSLALLVAISNQDRSLLPEVEGIKRDVSVCRQRGDELNKMYGQIKTSLDLVEKTAIKDDYPSSQWEGVRQLNLLSPESIGKLDVLRDEAQQTYAKFKKDKQAKQLSYNEEQIHRMDKEKLGRKMAVAKKIYDEQFAVLKEQHHQFGTWLGTGSETRRFQDQLTSADHRLTGLDYEYQKRVNELSKIEEFASMLIERHVTGSKSSPATQSSIPPHLPPVSDASIGASSSFRSPIPQIHLSQHLSQPQQLKQHQQQMLLESAASDTDGLMMSLQHLISNVPLDSLGMVPVPKPVKYALEHYEHSLTQFHQELVGGEGSNRPPRIPKT